METVPQYPHSRDHEAPRDQRASLAIWKAQTHKAFRLGRGISADGGRALEDPDFPSPPELSEVPTGTRSLHCQSVKRTSVVSTVSPGSLPGQNSLGHSNSSRQLTPCDFTTACSPAVFTTLLLKNRAADTTATSKHCYP